MGYIFGMLCCYAHKEIKARPKLLQIFQSTPIKILHAIIGMSITIVILKMHVSPIGVKELLLNGWLFLLIVSGLTVEPPQILSTVKNSIVIKIIGDYSYESYVVQSLFRHKFKIFTWLRKDYNFFISNT